MLKSIRKLKNGGQMYGPDPLVAYPKQTEWVAKIMAEVKPKFGGVLMMVTWIDDEEAELGLLTSDGPSVCIIERVIKPRPLAFIFGNSVTDHPVFGVVTTTFKHYVPHSCGPDYPEVKEIAERHSPYLNKDKA